MNLIVVVAIVLLNLYVTACISYQIPILSQKVCLISSKKGPTLACQS